MLNKIKKSRSDGFTIIEVMIVLAIAALILLIVLLAVPALQRNSRNTQRKNDASSVAAGVGNYISNNGGNLPTTVGTNGTNVLLCGASCAAGNQEASKLGFYTPGNVSVTNSNATAAPDADHVVIYKGYACNDTNTGVGPANSRTAAIVYATENGNSGSAVQCVEQ